MSTNIAAEAAPARPQIDENPFGVRYVEPRHAISLFALLVLAQAENGMAPINEQKVKDKISQGLARRGVIIGVIEGRDGLEASVGMQVVQTWYSDAVHLEDLWNYVHPAYRRSDHAKNLLRFVKWSVDRLNAKAAQAGEPPVPAYLGILTHDRLEAKMRLYQRELQQVGAVFCYGSDFPGFRNQRRLRLN